MICFSLRSPAKPSDIVAALRAHGGEWRESQIPVDLLRQGILGVECRIRGSTCILRYSPATARYDLQLTAKIIPDPQGGTLIEARVGYPVFHYPTAIGAAVLAIAGGWLFSSAGLAAVPPLIVAAVVCFNVLYVRQENGLILARERKPAYLIGRFESAVALADHGRDKQSPDS